MQQLTQNQVECYTYILHHNVNIYILDIKQYNIRKMSQIKNTQISEKDENSKIQLRKKRKNKSNADSHGTNHYANDDANDDAIKQKNKYMQKEGEGASQQLQEEVDMNGDTCGKKVNRKLEYCTDVLANYFECVRVFSTDKLEQLRRKSIQHIQKQQSLSQKSTLSDTLSQKHSVIQKNPDFNTKSKKQKNILIQDYNELPVHDYSTHHNNHLKFTKRYAEIYDKSYSERRNKFGYTFEEVQIQRHKQQERKEKNFWVELKRLLCCRGGNYVEELEELETDAESVIQDKKSSKRQKQSISSKRSQQNNIFHFQQQNQQKQQPQEPPQISKHGHKINRNIKLVHQSQSQYQEQNTLNQNQNKISSSRKTQNLQTNYTHNYGMQNDARKISSRLGVDTQLLVKRKQYEKKAQNQYNYTEEQLVEGRQDGQGRGEELGWEIEDSGNYRKNNGDYNTATNSSYGYSNNNINSNNAGTNNRAGKNSFYNDAFNEQPTYDQQLNRSQYQDGVAKVKADKKAKISKIIKQMQSQNDQQFNHNQVLFMNQDQSKTNQPNENTTTNNYLNNNTDYNNEQYNNNYENTNNNEQYNNNYNNSYDNNYNNQNSSNNNNSYNNEHDNLHNNQYNNYNNSIDQQFNPFSQEIKSKSKNKNKNKKNNNIFYAGDQDQQDNGEFVQQQYGGKQEEGDTWQGGRDQARDGYNNNSARLVVKDNQDHGKFGHTLDEIPNVEDQSQPHGQTSAFKKKRKVKKPIQQNPTTPQNDDLIIIQQPETLNQSQNHQTIEHQELSSPNKNQHQHQNENQNMSLVEGHQSYDNQNQSMNQSYMINSDIRGQAAQQQVKKKKKNKRANLIVQQGDTQEIVDLEEL